MENSFRQSQPLLRAKKFRPWLVGGGIFFVLLLVLGIWSWRYSLDHLVKFAPVDNLVYAHWQNPIGFWSKADMTQLPFSFWYQYINDRFEQKLDFQKDILAQTNEAAVLLLPAGNQTSLSLVVLARLSPRQVTGRLAALPQRQLGSNILAFSPKVETLEKITAVADGSVLPLAPATKSNFFTSPLFSLYLNAANLKPYWSPSIDWPAWSLGWWYLNLQEFKSGWRLTLKTDSVAPSSLVAASERLDFLPPDFIFYASGVDLAALFSGWLAANPELGAAWPQRAADFQRWYGLDLPSELAPIVASPAQLIIFSSASKAFGFDWALIVPRAAQLNLDNWEKFITLLLAQKLPRPVAKTLPDGTVVTELLIQPQSFVWQSESLGDDISARVLLEPRLDFSLAYSQVADRLIIGSSLDHLRSLLTDSSFSLMNLSQRCGLKDVSALAVFNNQALANSTPFFDYLPPGIVALEVSDNQTLAGCLVDN